MPARAFHSMSDEDLGAIIAYVKSVSPVDNPLPKRQVELMGRLMMGAGLFPPFAADQIDHTSEPPAESARGVTTAYGEYLTRVCTECHGANLNGAPFGPRGRKCHRPT